MITNLKNLKKNNRISAKVCIIGGGTVGLFLARRLRLSKIPVTIIEAGGEKIQATKKNTYTFNNYLYEGALINEKFILGGTSTIWGGQMIPVQKSDIQNRNYIGIKSWSINYESIAKYYSIVAKFLNFKFLKHSEIASKKKYLNFFNKDFDLRFSTFIKSKIKNFYEFFYKQIKEDKDLNIYINAKVFEINNSEDSNCVKNVIAKSDNGNILDINTEIVIICCGAIESTRLLLIYDKKNENCIKKNKSPLGNFFSDQLSFVCGKFIIKDWKKFNLYFSPIYENRLIHNPRFELKNRFQKKNKLPSSYCHLLFVKNKKNQLDLLLKELFQKRKFRFKSIILIIILSAPEIIKNIYNLFFFRILFRSVWFRMPKKILFSIVLEQVPNFNNKLFINNKNNFNELVIDWNIEKKNIKYIKLISKTFKTAWIKSGLNKIAELETSIPNNIKQKKFVSSAYHPTGSIRMGSKKSNSVVDKNLKLWNVNNMYICSTAIFPSSSCSNTGFTLLALAIKLEYHLKKKINKII